MHRDQVRHLRVRHGLQHVGFDILQDWIQAMGRLFEFADEICVGTADAGAGELERTALAFCRERNQ